MSSGSMTAGRAHPAQPYLPRLVLDWLRETPEARVWEIDGSMVFVDVSGFTKMSERLARQGKVGAEEVADVIGDTFGVLLGEAYAYGGSLLKFGGDSLLLFFSDEGHAQRAAAAAYGMRSELRRIGTFTTTAGQVTLRMSVGAHTGLFHFFLVGESHRELVVAGPAATETVAMEGAASAGQILLSPALAAALPAGNRGRPLGPGFLLRGVPPVSERTEPQLSSLIVDLSELIPAGLRDTVLGDATEPEHRTITIAFLHYAEFDALVERAGVDAAAEALDELVRAVQEAADSREVAFLATDIAPDGGKIILTAGAPRVTGMDEEQLLLALRDVVERELRLPLQIGVNRGPVFAGEIGPSYRRTYTVMGDAVNLAARLMAKAELGQVLASPEVLSGSRTLFETAELEPFLVKGKKKPVQALAVGQARGSRASIAEAGLPLLGRDAELGALLQAWESAQAGDGQVVELSADPGMGKSRLLDEFLVRIGDARVIRAECRLYQSATAYFPFRALLRSALELDGLDDDAAIEALDRLVTERSPALRPWLSLIATPLDLDIDASPEVLALDDRFRRSRLEDVVAELVTQVADSPTVVVVEDTHWMDESSRGLLARVTSALREHPWLVVLSRRPGSDGYVAADEGDALRHIELQPLGIDQSIELIDAATEGAPLRPRQVRELADRASGNPLFLIELLDALRRGDDVETLPHSVDGLIQARIDRLAAGDRRHLRELSVLGAGFHSEHASAVLSDGGGRLVARTLAVLGDFLSVDRTGWVQFRHALIRDAAYEGLPYRARRQLHARVGDSILAAAGPSAEDQAELLSFHYFHAGRWPEAWEYSRLAGDGAREVYANVEAARFYERALGSAQRQETVGPDEQVQVVMRLGEALEYAGLFERGLQALQRARRLVVGDPLRLAELHERRARILIRMGKQARAYTETVRGYGSVEGIEGQAAAKLRASLSAVASTIRVQQGRPRDALPLALRAVEEAEAAGEQAELALAYQLLDDVYVDLGRTDEAVFADRAIELFASIGRLDGVGMVELSVGVRAYAEGRWDDAVAANLRAQDAYTRAGNEAQAAIAAVNIGEVLVSQGRLDEAEALLREGIRIGRAHGSLVPALFGEIQEGRLLAARGQLEDAISSLERTRDEAVAAGMRSFAFESGMYLAETLVEAGDAGRALEVVDDEQERIGEYAVYFASSFARARARVLIALERLEEAETAVEEGLASAREHDALYDEAQLLLLRSVLELGDDADEALEEARRLLQRLGVVESALAYGAPRAPSTLE